MTDDIECQTCPVKTRLASTLTVIGDSTIRESAYVETPRDDQEAPNAIPVDTTHHSAPRASSATLPPPGTSTVPSGAECISGESREVSSPEHPIDPSLTPPNLLQEAKLGLLPTPKNSPGFLGGTVRYQDGRGNWHRGEIRSSAGNRPEVFCNGAYRSTLHSFLKNFNKTSTAFVDAGRRPPKTFFGYAVRTSSGSFVPAKTSAHPLRIFTTNDATSSDAPRAAPSTAAPPSVNAGSPEDTLARRTGRKQPPLTKTPRAPKVRSHPRTSGAPPLATQPLAETGDAETPCVPPEVSANFTKNVPDANCVRTYSRTSPPRAVEPFNG
ncbi:hypothetical protein T484DRAFT_1869889 [Baffinella frigidus]|nr:hypothetical protein T484DRAFT_1869889 [Cryptophyta sp. CCMP2293]